MELVQINEVGDMEHFGEETIPLTLTEKKDRWATCSSCSRKTCHEVIEGMCTHARIGDYESWDKFLIIRCKGCENLSFLKEHTLIMDDCTTDKNGRIIDGYESTQSIYPDPAALTKIQFMDDVEMLPQIVASIYKETCSTKSSGKYILTGAGLRAIVEAICLEKETKGEYLEDKIDNLAVKGIISTDQAKYLHGLRFMGNRALHKILAYSESEIRNAFEIVEHMLKAVYVIPAKAENLPFSKPENV
ncbi:hypothetical protein A3D11_03930 [Candidatus Peribacteria bacterium RIFCSPHIGHO2_02_FULL_49_16]|nr:MAG: hypothetical protein A2880_03165 [Candidatus Peribacteria bacterium RIFCSPHIGHO2_01_FULL_49_38]OGJ59151.1 MAG: hypothetical protein A3D11_03930 [Candidatus Peribacteria bacterium RIFCSPHIGHO2_02_FULL_49_16]